MTAVAVAGATGALGTQICAELQRHGLDVRALSRPSFDLTAPETIRPALADVACVVSTATAFPRSGAIDEVDRAGNIALVEAAEAAGVTRFVFVSFRPVPLDFPLQRAKRAVEERLDAAALEAIVLRPGKFMDIWFSPLVGFDVAARRATIFGDSMAPVSWIAAADVAAEVREAVLGRRSGTYELGGPQQLSQRDAVGVFERLTGARWSLDELPAAALERQLASDDPVESSLAGVMLEAHLGSVAPPVGATTLEEFATRLL